MDKNTLSNYGWIVIAVLVLSVMIALATPFGEYIKAGVESTTQGLFDVQENALNVVGMSAGPKEEPEYNTVSGSVVRVDDVSEISHTPKIKLSSDSVTDFSSVNVICTGKNILDITKFQGTNADNIVYNDTTNSATFTKTGDNVESYLYINMWLATGTYTVSANVSGGMGIFVVKDVENWKNINNTVEINASPTFTVTEAKEYKLMIMQPSTAMNGDTITFSNLQLELGTEKTSFEPYSAQTVTANADGTVTGITSVSPTMTIFSDSHVNITCEYQKKN